MDDDEYAAIYALRPTATFQTHYERMFAPLRPGFARVCCMAYVTGEQEEDVLYDAELPPALLDRARTDALTAIRSFETLVINTVERSVVQFMRQPDMYDGQTLSWNASNAEDMETNLCNFFDAHIGIWKESEYDEYKERLHCDPTLTPDDRAGLCCYVREFIEYAATSIPYYVGEGVDVYYDSASTDLDGGDE